MPKLENQHQNRSLSKQIMNKDLYDLFSFIFFLILNGVTKLKSCCYKAITYQEEKICTWFSIHDIYSLYLRSFPRSRVDIFTYFMRFYRFRPHDLVHR